MIKEMSADRSGAEKRVLDAYAKAQELQNALAGNEGHDTIGIFIRSTKQMNKLPPGYNINADETLLEKLGEIFGKENVKLT